MVQSALHTKFALLAFKDGREAIPHAVAEHSEVFSRLVGEEGSEASQKAALSGLPRQLLRAWALQHCRPENPGHETNPGNISDLVGMIQVRSCAQPVLGEPFYLLIFC